jgi:hypothetical protein
VKENEFCLHRIRPNETAEQTLYCHSTVAMLMISISTGDIDYCRTTPAQSVESEVDDRCRVERENLAHREAADNCIAERLTHLGPGSAFDYERRSTLADVRYWHKADMGLCAANVRYWGKADMRWCTAHVRF